MSQRIVIVGAGPAGLAAADRLTEELDSDLLVTVIDAKRSAGRKLLVAGKSGLNLTNAEPLEAFIDRYSEPRDRWRSLLAEFDNQQLRRWAESLGLSTFESAGGKVFPDPMKGGPLLKAWMDRLKARGVQFRFNSQLSGIDPLRLDDQEVIPADATILALGGASWQETGSNGLWRSMLEEHGIAIADFAPANCGWEVAWGEEVIQQIEGSPLKNISVSVGAHSRMGELTVTRYGLEGGPLYHLGPALRSEDGPVEIGIDWKPNLTEAEIIKRLRHVKKNYIREAKRRLKLPPAAGEILKSLPDIGPWTVESLSRSIKRCPIILHRPR
ncbi:MAG: TIGR03862 family flavoprotein, partial [Verrucomicrobiota bacterium]